ncbi:hypothetical protein ACLB2K_029792 [Fragaria x ananassa]
MTEDCAKIVKAQLLVSLGGNGNRCHCQIVQTPPKRCREGNGRSTIEADLIIETVDAQEHAKEQVKELSKVTRAASTSSSSPGTPLEKTRTFGKEGLFQSAISTHQRSLFKYAVKHKATEDRQMNRKPRSPYRPLMMPISSDDNLLINYAMAETSTEGSGRLNWGKVGNIETKGYFMPCTWENGGQLLIDYVALTLSKKCDEEWHFPTNFSEKALSLGGSKNTNLWVEETRMVCGLERWDGKLAQCKKMFLPFFDGSVGGHLILLLVDMDKRTAEVWDSAPSVFSNTTRWNIVSKMLGHLDRCFAYQKLDVLGKLFDFVYFPQSEPRCAPKQENDVDYGTIVSLNMIHYGSNWYKGGSNEYRARLLLKCLTAPMNEMWSETLEAARAFVSSKTPDPRSSMDIT